MTVQKNFKIVNGLEVNNNLIFADTDSNKVGIATTGVKHTLHVNGGIGATSLTVSGISTVNNLTINGRITAGSSLGAQGQYLISTGAGVSWANIPKLRQVDNQVATASQTTFNTVYSVGLLDVYVNGVRLSEDEFTAVNGATVTLDDACFGGETVEFISYSPSGVSVAQTGISGITILEEGTPVGSPLLVTSINFVGASVTAIGSGIGVTVYLSDYIGLSGVSTYASSAGIATYATAAGISTVSQGLTGTPNVQVGIVTATNVVIGGGTTQLIVTGNARVTGILTIGTSSITLNGPSNTINVGSGVTIDGNAGIISATSIVVGGTTITGGGVTSITAGSGISVDQSTGNVTITATGGGGSSQWVSTAAGIHTLSNVGIGTTNPGEKLQVDGNIRVGISTTSNYIAFRGTTFDGPGNTGGELPYQHTYLGERIYDYSGNGERSELLLFKGNDVSGGDGPDRIRLLAGEHRFDVLGFSTTGTFEQVGVSTAAINKLTITSTGVGIGTTDPISQLDVLGTVNFDCNDGNTFTSVGIGTSTVDISTPSLNLYVPNIAINAPGGYFQTDVGTFILNSDVISLNSLFPQTFILPTISIASSASGLPATFTLGQNIDGSGEDHLGLIYDNFGGTPGTGGVSRIFTSNGDLRIVTDYNGTATGSNITIGSEDIIFTDKTETQEYVRINSSGVGIGTTNPTTALQINGVLGFGTDEYGNTNIRIGDNTTGSSIIDGINNIFIGIGAGNFTTSGYWNNFLGSFAGFNNTNGGGNIFMGGYAGFNNTDGSSNTFLNDFAGYSNINGNANNFLGGFAGYSNIDGYHNNFFGNLAGNNNQSGNYNIYLGPLSGISTAASRKIIIGSGGPGPDLFDSPNTTKDTQFAVGVRTDENPSKYWLVGDENFNIGIGTTNPTSKLTVVGSGASLSQLYVTGVSTFSGNVRVGVDTSSGVILTSPNGTQYRLIVDNSGTLSTVAV